MAVLLVDGHDDVFLAKDVYLGRPLPDAWVCFREPASHIIKCNTA